MRPPLALHSALRSIRLLRPFPNTRPLAFNAIKRYSTAPPAPPSLAVEKPYYITSPIFYVNADPHVGHLYTLVLTDILKRWQQLLGNRAFMLTGTDEHGLKVQQAAALAEIEPKTFCKSGANSFKNLAHTGNCSYDRFIRTTDPDHRDAVQYFWEMLRQRNFIYQGKHEGWYCVSDETFYPETGIEDALDPATGNKIVISKETGKTVEWTSEINYHFRLSAMAPRLLEFFKANPDFIVPRSRYDEVIAAVERGLEDLSVSRPRDRLSWGIPVPNDDTQTIYVWLDALVNYITASGYPWTPGQEQAGGWPADLHVVGKDIVKFHGIYWPAFLLALGLPPPKKLLTHAHWTMNHKKMSKSDGNVVNPYHAIQRYGVDTMRFYMAHDGGIVNDGDYSNEQVVMRYRHELQFGLGNLTNRVLGVKFDLELAREQAPTGVWRMDIRDVLQQGLSQNASTDVAALMKEHDVPGALRQIMTLIHETNKYMQNAEPWNLSNEDQKNDQNKIIYLCAECVRVAAIMLQPFIPDKARAVLDLLAVDKKKRTFEYAEYGADTTYAADTKGKKGLVFPPLSDFQLMLWIAERDPGFTFTEKKALTPEQHRILNFGGDIKDPTVEVPPLVRKVIEHAKMAKYKKGRTEIWKAKMAVLNKETVAERQRKHRGWKKERDERRSSETPLERVRQESLEKEKGKPEEPWRVRESVRAWRAETGRAWESGMIQNKREWEQRMVRRMGPSAIPEGERKQVPRYTKESEFAIERAMVKRKKAKRAAAARASNPTGDYARESRPFTPQGDMRPVAYRKLEIGRK